MAHCTMQHVRILGSALALGEQKKEIADEPWLYDHSESQLKRLQKMIGFETRYEALPKTTAATLCLAAAKALLAKLSLPLEEIDGLIFVTQTPDYLMPGNGHVVHRDLGCTSGTAVYDLHLGCSGFIHGLSLAAALLSQGMKNILLLAGDTLSKLVDPKDSKTVPLFGDAGSATLLVRSHEPSHMFFTLGADGSGLSTMYVPNPRISSEKYHEKWEGADPTFIMDGFGTFQFTMTTQPDVLMETLRFAGKSLTDIDCFLLHQANRYIVETITQKAGIPAAKVPSTVFSSFGNLVSASIPAILCSDLRKKVASQRVLALLLAFGTGFSWGGCITELANLTCLEPFSLG